MWYAGSLFTRLACCRPQTHAYHELAGAAYGAKGRWLVYTTVYTLILLAPGVIHLTSAESLRVLLNGRSFIDPGLAIALVMLPLAQVRSMEDVGWVSILGTGTMVGAVAITLLQLSAKLVDDSGWNNGLHAAKTHVLPPASTTAATGVVALLDVAFAYGGCQNWFRYASTMRRRAQFSLVTCVGAVIMTGFYVLLGVIGYTAMGDGYDLSKPITSVLPPGLWASIINVLLLLHCLVAYQININVLTHLVLSAGPTWAQDHGGWRGTVAWACVSTSGICTSAALAAGMPYFNLVIAFAAAVGDVASGYLLPAMLALKLLKLNRIEKTVCRLLVPLSVVLSGAGIFSALREIAMQPRN